ncbi:protein of unknown function [Paramicrobacterium humi]|uniref:DUF4440 domain-containing protein n=1 Tax=Paramicrobacterium humi TaxID=640635 RepID=A0A1H4LK80_9MICO|nr:nuclear transport factor 2 family protein [Microbacterium humi]SEB70988.1 protein of unknown function [Microbacterium humi]
MVADAEREELLALERAGWQSLCNGMGAEFYERAMVLDGLMVLAGGFALDREGAIASLRDAPPWDSFDISDERFVQVSDDVVVLKYTGAAHRGSEPEFVALMTSSYVRVRGEWRLALYTQTPVAER